MKVKIGKYWVDVLDKECEWRPCFHLAQWKGNIIPGVGYQYAPESQWYWRCGRRADHGCPTPPCDPDPARARCCEDSAVRLVNAKYAMPKTQRCIYCGKWLKGFPLAVARRKWKEY